MYRTPNKKESSLSLQEELHLSNKKDELDSAKREIAHLSSEKKRMDTELRVLRSMAMTHRQAAAARLHENKTVTEEEAPLSQQDDNTIFISKVANGGSLSANNQVGMVHSNGANSNVREVDDGEVDLNQLMMLLGEKERGGCCIIT